MLSYDKALVEARQHLYSKSPPKNEVWVLRHGQRVKDGWFFWYNLQSLHYLVRSYPEDAAGGGAHGFTIRDDRSIQSHSWRDLPAEIDSQSSNIENPPRPTEIT